MYLFLKFIPALISWGIFIFVLLKVPYPTSLTQANLIQLTLFFIPLFLAIIFTINAFIKNIFVSSSISLGIISLLTLKALDSLNLVTALLTAVSVWLLIGYFKKINRKGLTKLPKISKLTHWRKQ